MTDFRQNGSLEIRNILENVSVESGNILNPENGVWQVTLIGFLHEVTVA